MIILILCIIGFVLLMVLYIYLPAMRKQRRLINSSKLIEAGMSEDQVNSLLGKPNLRSLSENGDVTYTWGGKNAYVEITFRNGVVVSVNSHGR